MRLRKIVSAPTDKAVVKKGSTVEKGKGTRKDTKTSKRNDEKPYIEVVNGGKQVTLCRAEPPCASHSTLMEKRSRMMEHLKKLSPRMFSHTVVVMLCQRLHSWVQEILCLPVAN
ncbi:hypothetical protein GOP47_0022755 [Adiantum capillus-veneris]|uniref:Uncharacterized protein n=1 Tax=Adiantum capillus-veneris TaxID=13818 RepID=A0A9D4Z758_ADICA|nr:hypothetical protein GOP47_0022755 [Adiantum capillus-veneris]